MDEFDADIGAGFGIERGIVVFEIKRDLAGNGEQLRLDAAGQRERRPERDGWCASPGRAASTRKIGLASSAASVSAVACTENSWRSRKVKSPAV